MHTRYQFSCVCGFLKQFLTKLHELIIFDIVLFIVYQHMYRQCLNCHDSVVDIIENIVITVRSGPVQSVFQ